MSAHLCRNTELIKRGSVWQHDSVRRFGFDLTKLRGVFPSWDFKCRVLKCLNECTDRCMYVCIRKCTRVVCARHSNPYSFAYETLLLVCGTYQLVSYIFTGRQFFVRLRQITPKLVGRITLHVYRVSLCDTFSCYKWTTRDSIKFSTCQKHHLRFWFVRELFINSSPTIVGLQRRCSRFYD